MFFFEDFHAILPWSRTVSGRSCLHPGAPGVTMHCLFQESEWEHMVEVSRWALGPGTGAVFEAPGTYIQYMFLIWENSVSCYAQNGGLKWVRLFMIHTFFFK